MTCGLCGYEFCWACGASASAADNHFGFMRGCGVKMMDETVKPGDKRAHQPCKFVCLAICRVIIFIILWPFILVLFPPFYVAASLAREGNKAYGCCGGLIFGIIGFFIGIFLLICWIPIWILYTLFLIVFALFSLIRCVFCYRCHCTDQQAASRAADENRRRAEAQLA